MKASRRAFCVRSCLITCNVSYIMQYHQDSQSLGPMECCVAKKRYQSSWFSFSLSASASPSEVLCGVPCMTRVLQPPRPLRRSHRLQHSLRAKLGSNKIAKCIPSYRTRLHQVPRMLVTNRNWKRHKKQVYQIVTQKSPMV